MGAMAHAEAASDLYAAAAAAGAPLLSCPAAGLAVSLRAMAAGSLPLVMVGPPILFQMCARRSAPPRFSLCVRVPACPCVCMSLALSVGLSLCSRPPFVSLSLSLADISVLRTRYHAARGAPAPAAPPPDVPEAAGGIGAPPPTR